MNNTRQSILCPNCRRLINRDESRCPYCGMSHPGARWKHLPANWFRDPDQIIRMMIYVNVGMYILSLLLSYRGARSANPLALFSPSSESLLLLGATGTIPIDRMGRWWSLISANWLHAGILHIFFNMFAFKQLAPLVIQEYGMYRMFVIYTLGGVVGFIVSYYAGVNFTIGASAAVCGLIGAILYYSRSRGGAYGQAIFSQVGGWVIGIFIFGFLVPGINNWGHGGGIAGGVLLGLALGYRERQPERFIHKALAGICLVVTAGILILAAASAFYIRFTSL